MALSTHKYVYIFKNLQILRYNDVVWNKLFDLTQQDFAFTLNPSQKTTFWRLGIRLSKTEDIEFFHPSNRYKKPEHDKYIDFNIGVGEWNGKIWSLPSRIHLAQYNLPDTEHILERRDNYQPYDRVNWNIKYLDQDNQLDLTFYTGTFSQFSAIYNLPDGFKYFKVFAWADESPFEIKCEAVIKNKPLSADTMETESRNPAVRYRESARPFKISNVFNPAIGVTEIAQEIGELLKLFEDPKGNMFGVFGQWGRGKTFLWTEIKKYLLATKESKPVFSTVEFHAWKYQDTPASWAYLYETLADVYFQEKHLAKWLEYKKGKEGVFYPGIWFVFLMDWLKGIFAIARDKVSTIWKKITLNITRLGIKRPIMSFLGFVIVACWTFVSFRKKIDLFFYITSGVTLLTLVKIIYLYYTYKPKALNILNSYTEKISFQKHLGLQAEIQKEIVFLLKTWIADKCIDKKKILLFVDDVDRCDENRIIQVVDSLKVMLEDEEIARRLIVLVALDERILKLAIKGKYRKLLDINQNSKKENQEDLMKLSREYIDKLFLSGIKLGHLTDEERVKIFDKVVEDRVEKEIVEEQPKVAEQPAVPDVSLQEVSQEEPSNDEVETPEDIIEENKKDLLEYEYHFLKEMLVFFKDPTPRSIKIYFYRYMLAKNILKHKFPEGSELYINWQDSDRSILPCMIAHYSQKLDTDEIQNDCISFLKEGKLKAEPEYFGKKKYSLDKAVFHELLKVVEMVIPY